MECTSITCLCCSDTSSGEHKCSPELVVSSTCLSRTLYVIFSFTYQALARIACHYENQQQCRSLYIANFTKRCGPRAMGWSSTVVTEDSMHQRQPASVCRKPRCSPALGGAVGVWVHERRAGGWARGGSGGHRDRTSGAAGKRAGPRRSCCARRAQGARR